MRKKLWQEGIKMIYHITSGDKIMVDFRFPLLVLLTLKWGFNPRRNLTMNINKNNATFVTLLNQNKLG